MKIISRLLFGFLLTSTLSISAQTQLATGTIISSSTRIVKGAPYSAEITSENAKTLADGNKITRTTKSFDFRDGEGRTRKEQDLKASGFSADFIVMKEAIIITDPIAGFTYYLNPTAKTARRVPIVSQIPAVRQPTTVPSGYSSKSESLGTQIIEGIETTGNRFVTTIAPDTIGNEKAIETVYEGWFSPELRITLLSKRTDPQTGDYTTKVTNIKRTEPDKSLFTVPADYKIITITEISNTP